jgi:hypothetical protein
MKTLKRRPTHKQILADLMKKNRIPEAIKEQHADIEDAIAERGGERGKLRRAEA